MVQIDDEFNFVKMLICQVPEWLPQDSTAAECSAAFLYASHRFRSEDGQLQDVPDMWSDSMAVVNALKSRPIRALVVSKPKAGMIHDFLR